ncbi:MAG: hypothetical protein ABTQ34_07790 [Bdellovibrionales bacterium]
MTMEAINTPTNSSCPACGMDQRESYRLLAEAASSLDLCLGCSGLTWEAEQAADVVRKHITRFLARPKDN